MKKAERLQNSRLYLLYGVHSRLIRKKSENNINKLSVTVNLGAYIYIVKECSNLSSVLTAEVSFTSDLTRLNNDFVRLLVRPLKCHRFTPILLLEERKGRLT